MNDRRKGYVRLFISQMEQYGMYEDVVASDEDLQDCIEVEFDILLTKKGVWKQLGRPDRKRRFYAVEKHPSPYWHGLWEYVTGDNKEKGGMCNPSFKGNTDRLNYVSDNAAFYDNMKNIEFPYEFIYGKEK